MPTPTITIPTPCHENWQQMTPTAQGRHCAACQTVVVDFTQFTDAELLAYLSQRTGQPTCGRFRAGQLGRPLRPTVAATAVSRWRAWLAAAVAVWSLREVAAPAVRAQAPTEQREQTVSTSDTLFFRGRVRHVGSADVIPGAIILLQKTSLTTTADSTGYFELRIPPGTQLSSEVLVVSALGYKSGLFSAIPNKSLNIALEADIEVVRTIIMGMIPSYSTPTHSPSLWQRVTRPFRR
ncbi:carboxypeptidase-like regulatory domain-containing protein [Hymenobacter profundi]|uniref:Carboxypeptidase-like regulatory domain-containing protein n=1 Tax=Hymenobacter profundi TaxID=1982110 RepID=A0ABS6WX06_9BACT|nr:carboxypeptidase-like regulatory domain-containing protein [Hymenobacter profundi]MBW3128137.1 carboxypeptidase-like regulatory domain-containing protein [Hymenobacter profundi]